MVTALYRRYRPEAFAEMIGQSQVTDPLMTALRTNRVNHAYLFSGPRGCGKTTSARILARCLNCAEGPTDTPCGVCPSCVELGRDGGGSLDVVEIDAASHNGVDDARDIRERAVFAPARDRFKIFILDEAHMVTPQGFNALLKIVEEPPEHVKFIFATTEPDKVIGTIRSRTHHYPFRLVPPAQLLEYVQQLCDSEGMQVAPGVLPLVVRAGGGSPRDTLSLLDQLMAGSENNTVEYERAVALLGYTHSALLGEVIDAIGVRDAAAAFGAVDRVIQTGQDPRRFVEDLLERLRDIIIVSATTSIEAAGAVLRGVPTDELQAMHHQAQQFGHAELSRTADIVNAALTEMTGATSPRLHLELMVARVLVPASDDTERGSLARIERLERRVGVETTDAPRAAAAPAPPATAPVSSPPAAAAIGRQAEPAPQVAREPVAQLTPEPMSAPASSALQPVAAPAAEARETAPAPSASPATSSTPTPAEPEPPVRAAVPAGPVSLQQVRDTWPEILEAVQKTKRSAWLVVFTATVRAFENDVLTLAFPSENDVNQFKQQQAPGQGVSEILRQAILDLLGVRVKYIARVEHPGAAAAPQGNAARSPEPTTARPPASEPAARPTATRSEAPSAPQQPAEVTSSWAVVTIPQSDPALDPAAEPVPEEDREPEPDFAEPAFRPTQAPAASAPRQAPVPASSPASTPSSAQASESPSVPTFTRGRPETPPARPAPVATTDSGRQRYGEAVVREILGANFIEEQPVAPRNPQRSDG
ncbi:DNA polymerase III subunit gamma/tau [Agreia sp. Leaf335]|uniref:DNA polymerase III subunit gamma and tau n=1 Tax=Agreia sp. Leaf335 TaxID=1736340 RepID=UPI0006F60C53|nr:DNA polymerase III subunit gamma and tau [Agreia sp. Leaf335]KQR24177.1 DNA polymerase III subunit gamma/tau [Agreia sp. Leaf335]